MQRAMPLAERCSKASSVVLFSCARYFSSCGDRVVAVTAHDPILATLRGNCSPRTVTTDLVPQIGAVVSALSDRLGLRWRVEGATRKFSKHLDFDLGRCDDRVFVASRFLGQSCCGATGAALVCLVDWGSCRSRLQECRIYVGDGKPIVVLFDSTRTLCTPNRVHPVNVGDAAPDR